MNLKLADFGNEKLYHLKDTKNIDLQILVVLPFDTTNSRQSIQLLTSPGILVTRLETSNLLIDCN